jgi:cell division protein FtsL
MVSFVVVGLLVFGVVTLQAILSQTSFRMRELERRSVQLHQSYGQLKLDVAELSSPGRIAHEAKRLGLRLPARVETITVDTPSRGSATQGRNAKPSFALKGVLGQEP